MSEIPYGSRVLLTGATGFVGSALYPALEEAGYEVRCLTRNVVKARERWPKREWAEGDLDRPESLTHALDGCDAAFYLVHGMSGGASDYRRREREEAARFAAMAGTAGLKRIVYLGGTYPKGSPSEHLASRLEVGQALREGPVPALELRACLIIGNGSLSWTIVRDLAARLPVMVLPAWMNSRMEPVSIVDVTAALTGALRIPLEESAWYDLPGPDVLSGKQILNLTSEALGLKHPVTLSIPFLTPWLSSHWLRFVSRADWSVARELVGGLKSDLLAVNGDYWLLIGHAHRTGFNEAARQALAEEDPDEIGGLAKQIETAVAHFHGSPLQDAVL